MSNAPPQQTVSEIKEGELIEGNFACVQKDLRTARNGGSYLTLTLRDSQGTVQARAFRDIDFLNQQFEKGDVVWVSARAQSYAGSVQLDIKAIRKAEGVAVREFLPQSYRDRDELQGFFEHLAGEVYDSELGSLLQAMRADEKLWQAFCQAPCTQAGHHAYLGGLLEHTVSVATIASHFVQLHPRLNSDLLLTAALVHDIGKTKEFVYSAQIELSREGKLLGHLQLGQAILLDLITRSKTVSAEKSALLLSCVMAHHGAQAIGLRDFACPEAQALYRINALDTSVKATLE